MMHGALSFVAFCVLLTGSLTAQPDNPFLLVLIDKKTEDALGPFPYDRGVLAAAVQRSAQLQAKGVVLKFFLNLPRSEKGDRELAEAMGKTKVLLQAGNQDAPGPNRLPDRFKLPLEAGGARKAHPAGPGAIPLLQLSARAYDVGFVDYFEQDRFPILEWYEDRYVKSLATECLELALDQKAYVTPGKSVAFGGRKLTLDSYSQAAIRFPANDDVSYVSFTDFLHSKTPLKDRVVIIGFDAERAPRVQTPIGPVRVHRAFYLALLSLYGSVTRQ